MSIAADGPQAEVFRTSPVEPWRIVRTRLRVTGAVTGPIEGGGRAGGYFTGATGITIYRGDAWPAEYLGQSFIGDVGSNIVHRKILEPDGVGLHRRSGRRRQRVRRLDRQLVSPGAVRQRARRHAVRHRRLPRGDRASAEPAAGDQEASRPDQRPRPRANLSRRARRFQAAARCRSLAKRTTAELVALLEHPNGWHRDTAVALLYERQDRAASQPLEKLARRRRSCRRRACTALYVLAGLNALSAGGAVAGGWPTRVRACANTPSGCPRRWRPDRPSWHDQLVRDGRRRRHASAVSTGVHAGRVQITRDASAPGRRSCTATRPIRGFAWRCSARSTKVPARCLRSLAADKNWRASDEGRELLLRTGSLHRPAKSTRGNRPSCWRPGCVAGRRTSPCGGDRARPGRRVWPRPRHVRRASWPRSATRKRSAILTEMLGVGPQPRRRRCQAADGLRVDAIRCWPLGNFAAAGPVLTRPALESAAARRAIGRARARLAQFRRPSDRRQRCWRPGRA